MWRSMRIDQRKRLGFTALEQMELWDRWQRDSNESTNRQYYAKGTDLPGYLLAHLNKVARQLNERPRKTLGFDLPSERFNACFASTG